MNAPESQFPLDVVDEADVSSALDRSIRRLLGECFPADHGVFSGGRCWHDCVPEFSVIHREAARVTGHVAIVDRTIRTAARALRVAGVQGVSVAPDRRGQRLGHRLLGRAMEEATRRGIAFGLLFCVPELEPYYVSTGWVRTDREVTMLDERGRPQGLTSKNIAMFLELTAEPFPLGPLDLQGRDW